MKGILLEVQMYLNQVTGDMYEEGKEMCTNAIKIRWSTSNQLKPRAQV